MFFGFSMLTSCFCPKDARGSGKPTARRKFFCVGEGKAKPLAPASPRVRGEVGFRAKRRNPGEGGLRESEPVEPPPHPICFASQELRLQIDLSRTRGEVGASGGR